MYIYILQMHSCTIPARIVQFATRYQYSHIAISLDKDCEQIYSFGRKNINNIFSGGFIVQKKSGDFYKKFNSTVCRIYELEISADKYQRLKEKLEYMENHSYLYKYDFLGIILRFLHIPVSFQHRYVCSQFVASILESCDILHFKKDPSFVRPQDFESFNNMKIVYQGRYLSY